MREIVPAVREAIAKQALSATPADAQAMPEVAAIARELSALLLSHLAYEEDKLDHGLARLALQP